MQLHDESISQLIISVGILERAVLLTALVICVNCAILYLYSIDVILRFDITCYMSVA